MRKRSHRIFIGVVLGLLILLCFYAALVLCIAVIGSGRADASMAEAESRDHIGFNTDAEAAAGPAEQIADFIEPAADRAQVCAGEIDMLAEQEAEAWIARAEAPGMRPLSLAEEEYLLRVLTQEVGSDEALSWCVVQCLYNACEYEGWRYTPYEILFEYGYTEPADFISETVCEAYDGIFMSGYVCETVGDAMYFYAPAHCDSRWHESQRFIVEINGVRFFGRW